MDKELLEDILAVTELLNSRSHLTDKDGEKALSPARYANVRSWMQDNHGAAVALYYGGMQKYRDAEFKALQENCKKMIAQIEREEEDRRLNNAYLKGQTIYAKRAFIISVIALSLSAGAIVVAILTATIWK